MLERKRVAGLGRGLSALMDERAGSTPARTMLPLADIVASATQPRRRFDAAAMDELIESVRARGVLQPILVRPVADRRFEIVAGERRRNSMKFQWLFANSTMLQRSRLRWSRISSAPISTRLRRPRASGD
jgi:hypothetical protein